MRKSISLIIILLLVLSSFGVATIGFNDLPSQGNVKDSENASINVHQLSNTERTSYGDIPPGYYKVTDVYTSGERVVRGIAPFGVAIPPKAQEEESKQPLGKDYIWLEGRQGLFAYFSRVETNYETEFRETIMTLEDNASKINEKEYWNLELGTNGFKAKIDYGMDGIDDFIVPNKDNVPILINGSNGDIIYSFPRSLPYEIVYDAAVGNLDDEPYREIVFVCGSLTDENVLYLKIFDDWKSNFAEIATIDIYQQFLSKYEHELVSLVKNATDVKLADIDGDGLDEIVYTTVIRIHSSNNWYVINRKCVGLVFDDMNAEFAEIPSNITESIFPESDNSQYTSSIAIGDFNGDSNYEIVVAFGWPYLFAYNESANEVSFVKLFTDLNTLFEEVVATAKDMDLDGRDELVVLNMHNDYDYEVWIVDLNMTAIQSYKSVSGLIMTGFIRMPGIDLVVGNFDNDTLPEIAIAILSRSYTNEWQKYIEIFSDITDGYKLIAYKDWNMYGYDEYIKPILITFPIDGKILLKYTGFHNESMSRPYIIAVMAAPPTIKGIAQNYGDSATLFGTAVSHTTSKTNGYTISTGVTLSFETGDLFKIVDIHASITFRRELTRTHTIEQTIEECRDFQGDYMHDYVIFESVTYDNYYYEVVVHPNKTFVGQWIAISIPRKPVVYKWTVDYFNSHNGDSPDIGSETFNHTIGEAWTYPSLNDVKRLKSLYVKRGFWTTDGTMAVGEGLGVNSIELDLEKVETTETTTTIGVEFEAGIAIAGVGLSTSVGLSSEYVYSISIGRTTKYQGMIGDIAAKDYEKFKYSVGLFVYNLYREKDHLAYQVVNYWVEDYEGPTNVSDPMADLVFYNPQLADIVVKISVYTGTSTTVSLILVVAGGSIILTLAGFLALKLVRRQGKTKRKMKRKGSKKK